jgi:hypothetical protein
VGDGARTKVHTNGFWRRYEMCRRIHVGQTVEMFHLLVAAITEKPRDDGVSHTVLSIGDWSV